jgi:hypothetical protein
VQGEVVGEMGEGNKNGGKLEGAKDRDVSGKYAGSTMGWTEVVVVIVVIAAVATASIIDVAPVATVRVIVINGGGDVAMLRDSEELNGWARER